MGIVREAGAVGEVRSMRDKWREFWSRHRDVQRFLADWFPVEWEQIRRCGIDPRFKANKNDPGEVWVGRYSCHKDPLCIWCAQIEEARRVSRLLDKFALCTPKGQEPEFWHIVQNSPVYEGEDVGWGELAAKDPPLFRQVVWRTLRDLYGDGLGALFCYHDFGERGPGHPSPHIDLTLNGWSLVGDKPVRVKRFDLRGGGYQQWQDTLRGHASVFMVDAGEGNFDVRHGEGWGNLYHVVKYQSRELLDLRKIEYNKRKGVVAWKSYKNNARTEYPAGSFLGAMRAHHERVGFSREQHYWYGFMSKRSIRKTTKVFGGEPRRHQGKCICKDCGDWEPTHLPDVVNKAGIGKSL